MPSQLCCVSFLAVRVAHSNGPICVSRPRPSWIDTSAAEGENYSSSDARCLHEAVVRSFQSKNNQSFMLRGKTHGNPAQTLFQLVTGYCLQSHLKTFLCLLQSSYRISRHALLSRFYLRRYPVGLCWSIKLRTVPSSLAVAQSLVYITACQPLTSTDLHLCMLSAIRRGQA